jgi:hypothetical protein
MPKPLHIQFLYLFNDAGIGQYVNVTDFISDKFKSSIKINHDTPVNPGAPYMFIEDLISRDLIVAENTEYHPKWVYKIKDDYFVPYMKDEINPKNNKLYFSITSSGLDYLDNHRQSELSFELNKSYKNVNDASITNYKTQRNLAILTLTLALASAVYSWRAYNKTDETAMAVERLRLEVRSWRIEQRTLSSQKAFDPVRLHK